MAKKHKYFRNLDYKNKLETLYNKTHRSYPCRVKFITKEPDTGELRKDIRFPTEVNINFARIGNSNRFEYWDRPEVDYSILKGVYGYGKQVKQYYKRHSNKLVRRTKDIYNHNSYRKIFDLWWTID